MFCNANSAGKCIYGQTISRPFRQSALIWPRFPISIKASAFTPGKPDHAEDTDTAPTPDIVIETFACELPDNVQTIILRHRPLWLNWEYLSAEDSNERLHLMPSLQAGGIQKYFWVYGFQRKSGGLLRERDYAEFARFDTETLRRQLKLPAKTRPNGCFSAIKAIFGQNG